LVSANSGDSRHSIEKRLAKARQRQSDGRDLYKRLRMTALRTAVTVPGILLHDRARASQTHPTIIRRDLARSPQICGSIVSAVF
jgi:hypothetical protein